MHWLVIGVLVCLAGYGQADGTSKKDELSHHKQCAPGTTWKSQCNDCECTPDGVRKCTRKGCPEEDMGKEMECAPHSRWMNDCNTCWCTENGVAACTLMGCSHYQLTVTQEKDEKHQEGATESPAAPKN